MSKPFSLLLSLFLLISTSFVFSQDWPSYLLYQKDGAVEHQYLGFSVAGAGDVNGDGRADFIIGAWGASAEAGSVYLFSGIDGNILFQKDGNAGGDRLGWAVASAGDVNGDGRNDFIVGAHLTNSGGLNDAGSVYLYSGSDGSLLYQKDGTAAGDVLGFSVASAGDVNGDGKADFIVGARGTDPGGLVDAGSAYLYSGADGSLLYQKDGNAPGASLGWSVASAGDVNGDGKADFIIGAPADLSGTLVSGSAFVYSGTDGSLLFQKDGIANGDLLGCSVAGVGDINGDGKADFIIGAWAADPGGISSAGAAYLYSGADGSLLYQKDGTKPSDFAGSSVAGAGDVNGDGKADFIVGARRADPDGFNNFGSAYIYSGTNGSLLFRVNGLGAGDEVGESVASAGDVNGDGKADVIIGAWGADSGGLTGAGSAYIYAYNNKGDINTDGKLTPSDLVYMLQCVFLGTGQCSLTLADLDCDGNISSADIVLELNLVFLSSLLTCIS